MRRLSFLLLFLFAVNLVSEVRVGLCLDEGVESSVTLEHESHAAPHADHHLCHLGHCGHLVSPCLSVAYFIPDLFRHVRPEAMSPTTRIVTPLKRPPIA